METKRYDETRLQETAETLKEGELVALPTEAVYGLDTNALSPDTVEKMFSIKGRPQDNPLTIRVASFEQVKEYVDNLHPAAEKAVKSFWSGPLTLIFKTKKDTLPPVVTGELSITAFRIPDNKKTLEAIELSGVPLVGPNANTSGKPSPTTANHVYHDLQGKTTGITDDGATRIGVESIVLDLGDPTAMPMILQPGAVTKEQIEAVIESPVTIDRHLVKENETPKAPGVRYKHYSPDTRVLMVKDGDWSIAIQWAKNKEIRAGVIASPEIADQVRTDTATVYMYNDNSVETAAKGLFAGLRGLDEPTLRLDLVFVQVYPETGLGDAYMDRSKKAAGQNYFEK